MAIVTTVSQQQSYTERFYTTKAKINTEVAVVKSSGRWPGAGLLGSSEEARGSRVRPRHALDSPSSLSRILMRPSTFHSLHAHTTLARRCYDIRLIARGRAEVPRWWTAGALLRPPPPRLVAISHFLTSRRRRHGCDVINGTSHGPPAAASPPPARACANGTASTERSFRKPPPRCRSSRPRFTSQRARRSGPHNFTVIPEFLIIAGHVSIILK